MTTGTATHTRHDSRRRFSVDDYYRMADVGILSGDDRVELLDGQVVEMSPIGTRHAVCVAKLGKVIALQLSGQAELWIQCPVHCDSFNEPEPDIALVRPPLDRYLESKPGPDDTLLLIEVADSSADKDRRVKVPLYATAGFPEVWLIDLDKNRVEIYRSPKDGQFTDIRLYTPGAVLSPSRIPDIEIELSDFLSD